MNSDASRASMGFLCLLALSLAAGCAAPRTVGEYFGDRARDAADCVRLSVGYGAGLHLRAHLPYLPPAGYGTAPRLRMYGWDGPAGAGAAAWDQTAGSLFLPPVIWVDADGRSPDLERLVGAASQPPSEPTAFRGVWRFKAAGLLWPDSAMYRTEYLRTIPPGTERADAWWLGIDATLGYVSIRAGVNPAQIADFILGFAGIDLLGDDHWVAETESAQAIIKAAREGDDREVRRLLRANSRLIYARDIGHSTPLYHAAQGAHLETMRTLIERGAHLDARRKTDGLTPVHAAARSGRPAAFDLIIEAGGDLDSPGLLEAAAEGGHPEIVEAAFPYAERASREDALRAAVRLGRVESAERLVRLGVPVTISSHVYHHFVRGTLLHAAAQGGHERMIDYLLDQGLEAGATDQYDMDAAAEYVQPDVWDEGPERVRWVLRHVAAEDATPLHLAAQAGSTEAVRKLIGAGAEPNARDARGRTPLFHPARAGRTELIGVLIAAGAGPDAADNDGSTPLHLAAAENNTDTAQLLLKTGGDPNARKEADGNAPLHLAARRGYTGIARLLLEHGATVDAPNRRGWTPLRIAMQMGHEDLVRALIEHGADVNRTEDHGTPLQLAVGRGDANIARILIAGGADVTVRDEERRTLLHLAARTGDLAVAEVLIEAGVDSSARCADDRTPADVAREHGHQEVAELLEEAAADR